VADEFSERYGDLLTGSYDCVDRIVLNAYYPLGHNPGGFRVWWRRWHGDSDEELDDAHLMRLAGRFARRVRAWAKANGVPVIDCKAGERKHQIAEDYLSGHAVGRGIFLILVARSRASVWKVNRSASGAITSLQKKIEHVNHYSFHIMDPDWGHMVIKMSGHPPFGAQVILNGHEYVACQAHAAGISFVKEGNCFTGIADPQGLAQIADTLSQPAAIGRLSRACDRWIYTACLCFGLDLAEQQASGFRYDYSVYQAEYSRNLIFASGARMDRVFGTVADRTRSRLNVPALRTLFGMKQRPAGTRQPSLKLAVVIEKPQYDLTLLKVHFGLLTLKGYTKGERVLRFEAIVHNTRTLKTGRALEKFPEITARLAGMAARFCTMLDCVDTGFVPDGTLDQLPLPAQVGATRTGGIDLNRPRMRAALAAAAALAPAPGGFSVADFAARVQAMTGQESYTIRQGAYDLRKLRGKNLAVKPGTSRRYQIPPEAVRTITALLTLRDHVIAPVLAGVSRPGSGRKPAHRTPVDDDYAALRADMQALFGHLGISTLPEAA
jgi:hypothetical protein